MNENKFADVEWEQPIKNNEMYGIDERFIIKLWRYIKKYYKYIVVCILSSMITIFIVK